MPKWKIRNLRVGFGSMLLSCMYFKFYGSATVWPQPIWKKLGVGDKYHCSIKVRNKKVVSQKNFFWNFMKWGIKGEISIDADFGPPRYVLVRGSSILAELSNEEISRVTQQLLCGKSHDFLAVFALAHSRINQIAYFFRGIIQEVFD